MALPANNTLLVISGDGMPPFAVRGINQTYEEIDAATNSFMRTVNGGLRDFGSPQFKNKYKTSISCNDQQSPAFDNLRAGDVVTMDCIGEMAYLTIGGAPQKVVVPGSSRVEGDFTFYRPRLFVMIKTKRQDHDEWGASIGWTLEAEEV
jgi:hypothetical protein